MKVALIGATGFVGSAILKELLNRDIAVTAISRNAGEISESDPQLVTVSADIFDRSALKNALSGADVVISAYNPGWANPDIYADFLKGSGVITEAVKEAEVPRLIVIGGAGSLLINGSQLVDSPEFPAEYKNGALAARDFLNVLKQETELDWVFFSPAIEMHQGITTGRTGNYRLGATSPVFDETGRSVLSVEDLAIVIVDEVLVPKHHREQFTAAY